MTGAITSCCGSAMVYGPGTGGPQGSCPRCTGCGRRQARVIFSTDGVTVLPPDPVRPWQWPGELAARRRARGRRAMRRVQRELDRMRSDLDRFT